MDRTRRAKMHSSENSERCPTCDALRLELAETRATANLHRAALERATAWASRLCSAHQTPDPLCRICHPAFAEQLDKIHSEGFISGSTNTISAAVDMLHGGIELQGPLGDALRTRDERATAGHFTKEQIQTACSNKPDKEISSYEYTLRCHLAAWLTEAGWGRREEIEARCCGCNCHVEGGGVPKHANCAACWNAGILKAREHAANEFQALYDKLTWPESHASLRDQLAETIARVREGKK